MGLAADGVSITSPEAGTLEVSRTTAEHVGEVALRNGLLLHKLSARRASLEEAYMSLTQDAVEYRAHTTTSRTENDLVSALDDPGTWRVFAGTVYSLVAAAVFSLGIGTLLRFHRRHRDRRADRPAAAAGRPQLHYIGLGRDDRQLPTAAGVLSVAHHRSSRDARCLPLRTSEPDRDGRLRCRPYRGGRRHAAPTRRLTPCIRYPKELSTMTAEVLAATEHLVLRRMTNDDAAALAAYRSDPVQAR